MLRRLRQIVQDANTVTARSIYQPVGGSLCAPGCPCCWFQLAFVGSVNIVLAVGNEEVATLLVVGRRDCVAHQVLANRCSACWVLYHSACVREWNVVSACASMQVYLGQCCVLPFVAQHACTQLKAADTMCCDIAHVSSVLV